MSLIYLYENLTRSRNHSDHMSLGQRTSELVRRVSRLQFSAQVEPENVQDEKEPRHFTSMEAMTILAQRPKKKRSRLESVTRIINQISSKLVNGFSVQDDWDVVVSGIEEEERSTGVGSIYSGSSTSDTKFDDDETSSKDEDEEEAEDIFSASKNMDNLN